MGAQKVRANFKDIESAAEQKDKDREMLAVNMAQAGNNRSLCVCEPDVNGSPGHPSSQVSLNEQTASDTRGTMILPDVPRFVVEVVVPRPGL